MDSTMMYQLVLDQLHTKQELVNLLPSIGTLLDAGTSINSTHMNSQQVFSQLYQSVTKARTQQQANRLQLLSTIEHQDEQEDSEDEIEAEEQEDNDWDGEEEGQEGQEEQEGEEGDIEGQEGLEGEEEGLQGLQGEDYGKIDEEQNEDDYEGLIDEEDDGEDVGLYGEELDEEEMESYGNERDSEEEREFEQEEQQLTKHKRNIYKPEAEEGDDEGEDLINDQFDQFREIELQNNEEAPTTEEKNDLQKQIEKYENRIIGQKDWVLQGEVKGTKRPLNSLLEQDLQFKTGIRLNQEVTPEYNSEIQTMIKQRVLDELYDDRVRYQHSHVLREQYSSLKEVSTDKSKLGLGELYEAEFKNHLGLADTKQDKLKQEIMESFKEVNYYLDSLSNANFTPKPTVGARNEVVISEQKVPLTMFGRNPEQPTKSIHRKMKGEKEEDNKAKRTKNKRISRQRNKEKARKQLNKKIEYGGVTKFEAKAALKGNKNTLKKDDMKYNRSGSFFSEMNKGKKSKPNPNIGKIRI